MKANVPRLLLSVALSWAFTATASSAATISATDAGSHVGQAATVEGVVSEVYTPRSGKVTFIDMAGRYPYNAFTGVIFARSMFAVGDVSGLAGRMVEITGTVQLYHGRPEIIVTSPAQISLR